jgi:hypothetical protein
MLTVMGSAIRLTRQHARARGWDERQTRRAIRAAVSQVADVHLATKLPDLQDLAFLHFAPAPSLSPEKAGATMAQDLMQFLQDPRIDELGDLGGTDVAKRWS